MAVIYEGEIVGTTDAAVATEHEHLGFGWPGSGQIVMTSKNTVRVTLCE